MSTSPDRLTRKCEFVYIFVKKNFQINATFSTEFANLFVELYSFEDTTVLDNFIGTGTTAISCIRKKRNYIGIDNTQIYINHANQRIENELQKR